MGLTRRGLVAGGLTLGMGGLVVPARRAGAEAGSVSIAYNVGLPSWDPTVGPSAVNPTIQAIYQSVFDQYVGQNPDLSFTPGLLEKWGWNAAGTEVWMDVRKGVVWHDGTPLTPEDVSWSLTRAGDPKSGNPIQFIWGNLSGFKIDGQRVTAQAKQFDPVLFKWMAFLTGYVLPRAYYEKVGPEGFEKKPVGTGPYMVDAYERNAFLRLKANPHYWGGKPAIDTVVFKFVTDASARVAEIEFGASDVTLEIPYEEFDRLKKKPGLKGVTTPISDIGMIFITNVAPMLDENVRQAMVHAVDKKLLVEKLLRGYGVPIDTLEAPQVRGLRPLDQDAARPEARGRIPEEERVLEVEAGEVHHPDHARLQAQRLRDDPGDRRHVAQRGHPRRHRGVRDRQAFRAAHGAQAGTGRVLQLGQRDRRSHHLHRLRDVRPVAALGLEDEGRGRADRPALGRAG